MSTRRLLVASAIALGACGSLHAADFPINYAVPDARLDTIRGGYDVGGLRVSLGLERTVLINGVEAIRQSITIPNVAQMSIDQANALRSVLSNTVISTGTNTGSADTASTGNQAASTAGAAQAAASAAPASAAATSQAVTLPTSVQAVTTANASGLLVQNSLDNQAIMATTKIDASVNTAGMLQNMRLDESIKDAVIQFRGN